MSKIASALTFRNRLRTALGSDLDWPIPLKRQGKALSRGIEKLTSVRVHRKVKNTLPEQPFDSHLLVLSKLYQRSRSLYLSEGGIFHSTLVSSPRSLSSSILMQPCIEYSPIEKEMIWAATDPIQKRNFNYLLTIRSYSSSLFHEQNHRILWNLLPPPPPAREKGALRRYLNFAESLVIATDMALGDELGPRIAPFFYLAGVTYDPGSTVRTEVSSRRFYRNYLQAVLFGTYLTLELYDPHFIQTVLKVLFPNLGSLVDRATHRSLRLDPRFIATTNRAWQKRYSGLLSKTFKRPGIPPLELPDEPSDNRLQYLIGEKWFEEIGL